MGLKYSHAHVTWRQQRAADGAATPRSASRNTSLYIPPPTERSSAPPCSKHNTVFVRAQLSCFLAAAAPLVSRAGLHSLYAAHTSSTQGLTACPPLCLDTELLLLLHCALTHSIPLNMYHCWLLLLLPPLSRHQDS